MTLERGTTIDERYAIESLLGRGGMGEVYLATDLRLRRKIALKVVREDKESPGAVGRLRREARAVAALSHPNVVTVHDVGEGADGTCFVVMELIAGETLYARMERRADTSLAQKMKWLVDVARALASAHDAGVIHRDVKPSNIMITDAGLAKVVDFGLARTLAPSSFHTHEGAQLGTPSYMAPEQLLGLEADARSDQFAFGMTAHRLLGDAYPGRPAKEMRLLSELVPEISPAIAAVIARTLSFDAKDRYATMKEVADALEKVDEAPRPRVETTLRDPETTLPSRTEREPHREDTAKLEDAPKAADARGVEVTRDATNPPATAILPPVGTKPLAPVPPKPKTLPMSPLAPHAARSSGRISIGERSSRSPTSFPASSTPPRSKSTALVVLCLIAVLVVAAIVSIIYAVQSFG